jgi:hypothetical protein
LSVAPLGFLLGFGLAVAELATHRPKGPSDVKKIIGPKSITFFHKHFFLRELAFLTQSPIIKFLKNFEKNDFTC